MDLFTTDNPLTSQPSWFDAKAHPLLSAVCSTAFLALCFTPAILVGLYCYFISDIGAEPNPFPDPWFDLAAGAGLSFIFAILFASVMVMAHRLLARIWTSRGTLGHSARLS